MSLKGTVDSCDSHSSLLFGCRQPHSPTLPAKPSLPHLRIKYTDADTDSIHSGGFLCSDEYTEAPK